MAAAPTQAIQTNFGQIAQQGVQQVQQAELMEEQRKERQYQKMQDLEDRYGIPPEDFVLEDTEFRTLNDVTTEAMSGARDRYYDVYKQLEKDPTNVNLKKQLSRIKGSVAQISATHEKFMQLGEDYVTKLQNDEISGVDEDDLMEKLQSIEKGRYKIRWDDNDRLQVLTYDKEGNLSDTLNYKELINRDVISKVKVDEDLDKFMERLGEDNLTIAEGNRLVTSNQFGERQEQAAREHINSIIGTNEASLNENDALADLLYQATNGEVKKREGFTERDRNTVREWMMNKVRGRYDNKVTMAADPVFQQQQANYRASQSGNDKKPSLDKLVPAVDNDKGGAVMRNNGVVLKYAGGIKLDPTKSDEIFDEVRMLPNGNLQLIGQDRIKIKGVQYPQGTEIEDVANDLAMDVNSLQEGGIDPASGMVTYYKVVDNRVSNNERDLNKFAQLVTNGGDLDVLKAAVKNKLSDKWGEENLNRFLRGEITQKELEQSTQQAAPTQTTPVVQEGNVR